MSKRQDEGQKMVYRVFTMAGTHCIRKFDSLEAAKHWCMVHENDYRIEWQYEEEDSPRRFYM